MEEATLQCLWPWTAGNKPALLPVTFMRYAFGSDEVAWGGKRGGGLCQLADVNFWNGRWRYVGRLLVSDFDGRRPREIRPLNFGMSCDLSARVSNRSRWKILQCLEVFGRGFVMRHVVCIDWLPSLFKLQMRTSLFALTVPYNSVNFLMCLCLYFLFGHLLTCARTTVSVIALVVLLWSVHTFLRLLTSSVTT